MQKIPQSDIANGDYRRRYVYEQFFYDFYFCEQMAHRNIIVSTKYRIRRP